MFFAHSTQEQNCGSWEPLERHLSEVSALAERFGAVFGCAQICSVAGLFHDLGKYNPAFQRRLSGASESVDHSTAGAAMLVELAHDPESRLLAELIAYAIAGHHAGLPDRRGDSGAALTQRLGSFDPTSLDPVWKTEISHSGVLRLPAFRWEAEDKARFGFQFALLGRMVFSALVDADFKATEAFFAEHAGYRPDRDWPALADIVATLAEKLDTRLAGFGEPATPLAATRREVLTHVRGRAGDPPGLFTLTVPTGGGKTLTSLAFALDHARRHGKRRIIYAIPFTSIVDQTARQFRDLFGADVVLEHHSSLDRSERKPKDTRDEDELSGIGKLRLAMQDWAAPIVVTTNVQLFESLFAARTSPARKLHNIANSVIVLDEAQTLPRRLLYPVLRTIEALQRDYGCTVVLCTATQPALDARNLRGGLALAGRELAPDPARLARKLVRVTLRQAGDMRDDALAKELAEHPQGLVIVNSRKHALALFRAAQEAGLEGLIHLSTRMCAAHRRPLVDGIKQTLADKRPCRVIATSLIEAGVDIDFPRVWRAEAGLDQIAQAAGRCNREGTRPVEQSVVTLFVAPDNPPPTEIRGLVSDRLRMERDFDDLFAPEAMTRYFEEVYWRLGPEQLDRGSDGRSILGHFAIDNGHTEFSYRSAAENFRMIESGMVQAIVPFDETARTLIAQLPVAGISSGRLARELQPYVVQVPPKARQRLIDCGRAAFASPDLRADQFAVLSDKALYDEEAGLVWEDAEYLGTEDLVLT